MVSVLPLAGDTVRCFLGQVNSHNASHHPVVQMDTGEFNAGGTLAID